MYKQYVNLYILIQNFLLLWQRYYFSEGHIVYQKSTKQAATQMVEYFFRCASNDKNLLNTKSITLNDQDNTSHVTEVMKGIKDWAESERRNLTFEGIEDLEEASHIVRPLLLCECVYLCSKLKLDVFPMLMDSSLDGALHANYVKWKSHIHWTAIDYMNNEYLGLISSSDTIVLVADIRHSQDLVTYSPTPIFFRDNLSALLDRCRKAVIDNFGIFERVTGDGFICYFNKALCAQFNKDYYSCLLDACKSIQSVASDMFPEWVSQLRKVPEESIGIALGIDSGHVAFSESDGQLSAISEASVWATRMCSEGKAGQIIANNIPYNYLVKSDYPVTFKEISSTAKNGETFRAHIVEINELDRQKINEYGDQDRES